MNKVALIGRLTRDPELRFAAGSGTAVSPGDGCYSSVRAGDAHRGFRHNFAQRRTLARRRPRREAARYTRHEIFCYSVGDSVSGAGNIFAFCL